MIIKVLQMPDDLGKTIRVGSRKEIERIGKLLGKPLLEISKAQLHQMGIPSEESYHQLAVLDNNGFFYIYRRSNK